MKVSYFSSATKPVIKIKSAPPGKQYIHYPTINLEFEQIIQAVQSRRFEAGIEAIKKDNYQERKKDLACFTPSGVFRLRLDIDLVIYSGIICLDYDKVDSVFHLKQEAEKIPYTFASFYSPSWQGLKVFVRVETPADMHLIAYQAVQKYYDNSLGIESDKRCKNVSRLCFLSSDPDVVYKPEAAVFPQSDILKITGSDNDKKESAAVTPDLELLASNANSVFGWLYNFTMKAQNSYSEGNRNNFIFCFCCNCNRYGVDQATALEFAKLIWSKDSEGFDLKEVEKTVQSAYNYHHEHRKFKLPHFKTLY